MTRLRQGFGGHGADGPVLVVGATSDIGRAIARAYAAQGRTIVLAARDLAAIEPDAQDLRVRFGVDARAVKLDVLADDPARSFKALPALPSTVVSVVGLMGGPPGDAQDPAEARKLMETNYVAPALFLAEAARRMRVGGGLIVGISSVAGDRGRAANYVYGSAKAGFTAFLSGLRAQAAGSRLRVMTVKPGFVRTRMTRGVALPAALTAEPEEVARAVVRADRSGQEVVYVRPIWRLIMLGIRALPEPVFKRMKL